jgi:MGT family glycosyltransferase
MTHFGAFCPPVHSHLNAIAALGGELRRRGHRVTCFHIPEVTEKVIGLGLESWPIGAAEYPNGTWAAFQAKLAELTGLNATLYWHEDNVRMAGVICREAPTALQAAGVEALLVDQMEPAAGSVAEHLGLPFVTLCVGLAILADTSVPPNFTPWLYSHSPLARLRNRLMALAASRTLKPVEEVINRHRRAWGLAIEADLSASFFSSRLAQISQVPAEFDFPRQALPGYFHYTGPLRNFVSESVPFPYERLNGKPLIYASLGTLVNRRPEVFRTIAAACQGLDVQLVLSLGGGGDPEMYRELPGDPIVVRYAPQVELIARSQLTITHAGLNSVLESLRCGVPLVAIPITFEQPGIAARVQWNGAGEVVPLVRLETARLREAIRKVLHEPGYKQNALRLQEAFARCGGVSRAADLVEMAIHRCRTLGTAL